MRGPIFLQLSLLATTVFTYSSSVKLKKHHATGDKRGRMRPITVSSLSYFGYVQNYFYLEVNLKIPVH